MKNFVIDEQKIQKLLGYLQNKPWLEANDLIISLLKLDEIPTMQQPFKPMAVKDAEVVSEEKTTAQG